MKLFCFFNLSLKCIYLHRHLSFSIYVIGLLFFNSHNHMAPFHVTSAFFKSFLDGYNQQVVLFNTLFNLETYLIVDVELVVNTISHFVFVKHY